MKELVKSVTEIILSVVKDACNFNVSKDYKGANFIDFDTSIISINQLRSISYKLRNRLEIIVSNVSFFPSLDDNNMITISIVFI